MMFLRWKLLNLKQTQSNQKPSNLTFEGFFNVIINLISSRVYRNYDYPMEKYVVSSHLEQSD